MWFMQTFHNLVLAQATIVLLKKLQAEKLTPLFSKLQKDLKIAKNT
jgi:hypothetical protein